MRDKPSPPLIGYMRFSKADGSQVLDLQRNALVAAGYGATVDTTIAGGKLVFGIFAALAPEG